MVLFYFHSYVIRRSHLLSKHSLCSSLVSCFLSFFYLCLCGVLFLWCAVCMVSCHGVLFVQCTVFWCAVCTVCFL